MPNRYVSFDGVSKFNQSLATMLAIQLLFLLLVGRPVAAESFRFHLLTEPHSLDSQMVGFSGGNYVYQNIFRGLYRYHSQKGLIKEGAKDCVRAALKLTCRLSPQHRWSDGRRVQAEDYVKSFVRVMDPSVKSHQSELLLLLKNAQAIGRGDVPPEKLGVKALDHYTLRFEFAEEDPEFEYKLINSALAPTPPTGILERKRSPQMLFSGPYKISAWKPGHYVHLDPNLAYALPANRKRPKLEVLFVEDDGTALRLYESGKLNFLRRLTSEDTARYRDTPDFMQVPQARFDYVGFGPQLEGHDKLRQALSHGVDFMSFMKLFVTVGPPGCPSLPARFLDRSTCLKFNPTESKLLAKQDPLDKLVLHFSLLGGDDIARISEWFQGQWKKHLGLSVELHSEEQGVYLQRLRASPPAIFRKGVSLDRPTCLAAVELFLKGSPENYIRFDSPEYEKAVTSLRAAATPSARKVECRKAIEILLNSHRLIPLGEMFFTILVQPKFKGWDLNELNQLDLTDLTEVKPEP